MLELNKIYCGDCLGIMKKIDDKSIDLVLTDPPYGIGSSNVKRGGKRSGRSLAKSRYYEFADWDNNKPSKEIFNEIFRISKNQIIFGGEHLSHLLPQSRGWIFWDKDTGDNQYADGELIWTSFDKALRKFKWQWKGIFQEDMRHKEIRFHPTQKPIKLFCRILRDYSNENDLILDPFLGSGTTAIACKQLNRNFIGIEINPDYVDIANRRLANTYRQIELIK